MTEAQKKANAKYNKKTYCKASCQVRKDYYEKFKESCERHGTTVNAVLKAAIDVFMENYGEK